MRTDMNALHRELLAALAVLAAGAVGCDETAPTPEHSERPPARPEGAPAGDGAGETFAVTRYFIGTRTRDGATEADAWEQYGYDRDGVITVDDFDGHCRPVGGAAPKDVFPDGAGGVDNAFGKVVVPLLRYVAEGEFALAPGDVDLESLVNAELGAATSGLIIHARNLGAGSNYDPIDVFVYEASASGEGSWLLAPASVAGAQAPTLEQLLLSGRTRFPSSYVTDDVVVALEDEGADLVLELSLDLGGLALPLRLHHPIITMQLRPTHDAGSAGIISAILRTDELADALRTHLAAIDSSFCDGSAVEGVINQFRQASDIVVDGEHDPGAGCDGISIALGFEAGAARVTGAAEPVNVAPFPCDGE